ncbi:hypothetical protein MCQ_01002, partial [Candidatus Bartonella washoeensis Sb944nv]
DAAGNAAENNYLSSAQQAQKKKELEECSDKWCRRDVNEKWHEIDEEQDRIFASSATAGAIVGAGQGIYEVVHGVVALGLAIASNPIESGKTAVKGVGTAISWATSGHVIDDVYGSFGQFWGGVSDSFVGHINHITETMDKEGGDGALGAGFEFGQMTGKPLGEVASLFIGGGLAEGGTKLVGKLIEKDLIKFAAKTEAEVTKAGKEVAQSLGKMSDEVVATQYLGQERKFWSTDPIEAEFEMTYKGEKITQKNKVYQRDDLFDPNQIVTWTVNGKEVKGTNIERMKAGRAPIGFDNEPVELHHMLQTHNGPLAEVTNEFHNEHHSVIHINPNTMGSGIDRDIFDRWRPKYWKERAKAIEEKMKLKQQQFMEKKL